MTLRTVQRALVVPTERAPWELRTDFPVPTPGPQELLVKVMASALNPADWFVQTFGISFVKDYPYVGGIDGAGVVEIVGEGVTSFEKGDKILFPGGVIPRNSTFTEFCVCQAEFTAKIPDNITFEQASTIPLCIATAISSIWSHHPDSISLNFPYPWEEGGATKYAGKPALIIGGSSGVGQFAIQAARMNGFSPIIATSSLKHTMFLKSIGATHILDRALSPEKILDEISNITGGAPLAYAFDVVSDKTTLGMAYDALAEGGGMVSVLPGGSEPLLADHVREGDKKRVVHAAGSLHRIPANRALDLEVYKRVSDWLKDGTLVPARVELLHGGLKGIVGGLERLKNKEISGVKLVVRPQETP